MQGNPVVTDYRGADVDMLSMRYNISSLETAEPVFPGCSVYWDRDGMDEWLNGRWMRVYTDSGYILTAMTEFIDKKTWYVEYRADPVPHWATQEDIKYFNPNYGASTERKFFV